MTHLGPQHVVLCCSGQSGLLFLAAAVRSLVDTHSSPDRLRVHVIFEHLEQTDLERLQSSWEPYSRIGQVFFYRMSDFLGEKALDPRYGYWFRTWMHKALPQEIERVLYLDTDLIVLQDISELWDVDLSDKLGAMVEDPGAAQAKLELADFGQLIGIQYDLNQIYFNTGVILINLPRWRENNVGAILDASFEKHRPHSCHFDQGEINLLLSTQFTQISSVWNCIQHPSFDYLCKRKSTPLETEIRIRHFAGPTKVTARWRRLSEKKNFYNFLDRTAWKGWRSPEDSSILGRLSAQLLECRYLINNKESLPDFRKRYLSLLCQNPTLPLVRLLLPLIRIARKWVTGEVIP